MWCFKCLAIGSGKLILPQASAYWANNYLSKSTLETLEKGVKYVQS